MQQTVSVLMIFLSHLQLVKIKNQKLKCGMELIWVTVTIIKVWTVQLLWILRRYQKLLNFRDSDIRRACESSYNSAECHPKMESRFLFFWKPVAYRYIILRLAVLASKCWFQRVPRYSSSIEIYSPNGKCCGYCNVTESSLKRKPLQRTLQTSADWYISRNFLSTGQKVWLM